MRVSPTRSVVGRLVVGALAAGGMTVALGGSPAWAGTSPKEVVLNAITATEATTSVKIVGSVTEGTETISLNISASTSGVGQGTIGINKQVATVRLVAGIVYFRADTQFWTAESGKSAAQLFANKWVDTAETTSTGQPLAQFLNSDTFMQQLFGPNLDNSTFTDVGTARVDGKTAVVISGVDKKSKSKGDIYIAKSGTPYILRLTIGGKGDKGGLTFSDYNQPVTPVVPSGAIDLDTLSG